MADQDVLGSFDYGQYSKPGQFLKFTPGEPVKVRILTTDPVISESEFTDQRTGELTLNTRFAYIVYNFTDKKAQIMQVTPKSAKRIAEIHMDQEYGANIRNVDIRITPPAKGEIKAYTFEVMPNTQQLTKEMVDEARGIDLDNNVKDSKGRMSELMRMQEEAKSAGSGVGSGGSGEGSGRAAARAQADAIRNKNRTETEPEQGSAAEDLPPANPDTVIEDIGDEPINLDDIPF